MIFHTSIAYIAPDKWNKAQVKQWINEVCEECEIEEDDVSMLKTLSGAGLAHLTRQDFKERCPKQGDLIFTLWKRLLNKSTEEPESDSAKSPPNSPRKGKQYTNCYKYLFYFIRETGGRNQSEVLASMWMTTLLVAYYMNVNLYALYAQSFMISCLREFYSFNILRYDSKGKKFTRLVDSIH